MLISNPSIGGMNVYRRSGVCTSVVATSVVTTVFNGESEDFNI